MYAKSTSGRSKDIADLAFVKFLTECKPYTHWGLASLSTGSSNSCRHFGLHDISYQAADYLTATVNSQISPQMPIPALRITVNGQLLAIAGAEILSLLTATIGLGSGTQKYIDAGNVMFGVMGLELHSNQPNQLNWGSEANLKEGDQVTIEIVRVEQTTPPDRVLSTPSPTQLRAQAKRKQTYPFDLRAKIFHHSAPGAG